MIVGVYAPGLPPGTYALQASLPGSAMLLASITGDRAVDIELIMGGALQVFYGNRYRLKDAKPIELHEGEERAGLDIDIPTTLHQRLARPRDDERLAFRAFSTSRDRCVFASCIFTACSAVFPLVHLA